MNLCFFMTGVVYGALYSFVLVGVCCANFAIKYLRYLFFIYLRVSYLFYNNSARFLL